MATLGLRRGTSRQPARTGRAEAQVIARQQALINADREALRRELMRALEAGTAQDVRLLVRRGAPLIADFDLDEFGNDKGTALDLALQRKRPVIATELLALAAVTKVPPQMTVLEESDDEEKVPAKKPGKDAGRFDSNGKFTGEAPPPPFRAPVPGEQEAQHLVARSVRALALAARDGREHLLRELLRLNAPVQAKDAAGRSPLLLATRGGHRSCVQALLEAGAWSEEAAPQAVVDWAANMRLDEVFSSSGVPMEPRWREPPSSSATPTPRMLPWLTRSPQPTAKTSSSPRRKARPAPRPRSARSNRDQQLSARREALWQQRAASAMG